MNRAELTDELDLDCVDLKRRIQEQIAAEMEGMTPQERLAYVRKLVESSPFYALLEERRGEEPARGAAS